MKLYFAPATRATRPRWMLEELGVPYELVTVDLGGGEAKTPEYRKIHPLGRIPALVDGEVTVFESTAICLYLADRFHERGLAPALDDPSRGPYLQWVVFCVSTIEPEIGLLTQHTVRLPEEQRVAPIAEKARKRFEESLGVLEGTLGSRPFLLGDRFTTADLIAGANLRVASRSGILVGVPGLERYLERLMARPAAVRAFG